MRIKLTEQDFIEKYSRQHAGDGQGYLMAQIGAIVNGTLDMPLTADHEAAWAAEILARTEVMQ